MNYDTVHNISYRLEKQLSLGVNCNPETILEVLRDLLCSCQGKVIDSKKILGSLTKLTHVKDLRVKKLVYLYLSYVSDEDSEIWLHVMNSVSNDLADPSPFVRRSALSFLTDSHSVSDSLNDVRVSHIVKMLKDSNPSVRKYAVAGIEKLIALFDIHEVDFDMSSTLDNITQMIYLDDDPKVIVECIHCLRSCKKQAVKTDLLVSLLEKMDMLGSWTKAEIVNLFLRIVNPYKMTHEEIFQSLNLMDPCLNQKFPIYLGLSCATAMLIISKRFSDIHCDVKTRVLDYLVTISSFVPDHMRHSHLAVMDIVVDQSTVSKLLPRYKQYLPLPSDDQFMKILKLKLLRKMTTKENASHSFKVVTNIVMTASEVELVHFAVETLLFVHNHLPAECERFLQSILKHDLPAVVEAAVLVLWRIVFSKEELGSLDVDSLSDALISIYDKLSSFDTKCAFFSFMCLYSPKRHAKRLSSILNAESSAWSSIKVPMFKLTLLRSSVAFYFLFPTHFKAILGRIFVLASQDDILLINRQAIMYYTLLRHDINAARKYVLDVTKLKHCENNSVNLAVESLQSLCLVGLETG